MDPTLGWTIAGVVLATALGVFAIAFQAIMHSRSHPRQRIEYQVSSRRLNSSDAELVGIKVSIAGAEVKDPYLTEILIRSNSRRDIGSQEFDGSESLSIRVEPSGAYLLRSEGSSDHAFLLDPHHGDEVSRTQFDFKPQLIRKGAVRRLSLVSSGQPTVNVQSPLLNIDVVRVITSDADVWLGQDNAAFGGMIMVGVGFLAAVIALAWLTPLEGFDLLFVSAGIGIVVGIATWLLAFAMRGRRRVSRPLA